MNEIVSFQPNDIVYHRPIVTEKNNCRKKIISKTGDSKDRSESSPNPVKRKIF